MENQLNLFEVDRAARYLDEERKIQRILESRGYTVMRSSGEYNQSDLILGREIDHRLTVVGFAEIKSREFAGKAPMTLEYIRANGGYLISYSKLKHGQRLSALHRVPYFIIVNLMLTRQLLIFQITDYAGGFVYPFESNFTETKMNVNGGSATRLNSFLPAEGEFFNCSSY